MSDAKVVRIRQNLERVIVNALEQLGDTLEHCPPRRSGTYRMRVSVHIDEVGEHGEVAGSFSFEQESVKKVETNEGR